MGSREPVDLSKKQTPQEQDIDSSKKPVSQLTTEDLRADNLLEKSIDSNNRSCAALYTRRILVNP